MDLRSTLFVAATMFAGIMSSAAELKDNTVYRVNNVGYSGRTMAISAAGNGIVALSTDADDLKQQWYVTANNDNTGYYFRNVASGAYLVSSKQTSAQWSAAFADTPVDANMLMSVTEQNGNLIFRAKSDASNYGYAHNDAGNSIVCWEPGNVHTQWSFEEIKLSDEELAAIQNRFKDTADEIAKTATYQVHLDELFADKACTVLKASGDLSQNPHYQALSPGLKSMVDKVKSGNWAETKGNWDNAHAKKYRVQLYEPYSEGSAAASMAGIQAYTNMNNPTGILGDTDDIMYIMVDGEVPDGATLYIGAAADGGMYNSVTTGTRLHGGLNTIMCYADHSHYYIYYTVNTVKNGTPSEYKVTSFEPLKIHIEGGRLNGFFNPIGDELYTPDTREDYDYTVARATHPMYDLLGKYVILHFFLEDTPDMPEQTVKQMGVKSSLDPKINTGNDCEYDPVKIIKSWDNMCFAERVLMGIQNDADIADAYNRGCYSSIVGDNYKLGEYIGDPGFHYSDYFNNRMMGITLQSSGLYMNATSWRTAYAPSTVKTILTKFYHDGLWGPAHEYGHMNQGPIRFAGTTEESNNVFSNVALYFSDKSTTSRSDYLSDQLKVFNEGKTFLENGTMGTTRMFWQLWCYYHATKHNTKFYPRLYELLRRNPLKRTMQNGKLNPRYDMLHFAKMCCVAAGEDLTDFFTAWGFFVPLDNYHISDYDEYDCVLTQADIDAVKSEIAAMKLPVNRAIILIDDRPGSDKPSESGHPKENAGELGGLGAFNSGAIPSGSFRYAVDGTTVTITVEGTDGVGYLIYDINGNLLGFSNSHTFDVSSDAAAALLAGNATIIAIGSDNKTTAEVKNTAISGSVDEKKSLLRSLLGTCDDLLAYMDETETHVGYFYPEACANLLAKSADAKKMLESSATSGDSLTEAYLNLYDEYYKLANDDKARIPVISGAAYHVVSNYYPTKALQSGSPYCESVVVNDSDEAVPFSQQWVFESAGDNNKFYLRSLDNGLYVGAVKQSSAQLPMTDVPQEFTLVSPEQGVFGFAPDGQANFGMHMDSSGRIVHWPTSAGASHWSITLSSTTDYLALREELVEKIDKAKDLLDTVGDVIGLEPREMRFPNPDDGESFYSNAPYSGSNASDKLTSWKVLFDNNTSTYFHSEYENRESIDGLDHYLRIKAPSGEEFRYFTFSYTTRNMGSGDNARPTAFKIESSADCASWREIYSVANGLPTGGSQTFITDEIEAPLGTEYIRFMVTKSGKKPYNHYFFAVAEISIVNRQELSCKPDAAYPGVSSAIMEDLCKAVMDGKEGYSSSSTSFEDLTELLTRIDNSYEVLWSAMNGAESVDDRICDDSADEPSVYYNLQGIKINQPSTGVYIRLRNGSASKILK